MPTYNLTERTIEDLQREVDRLRGALREIISMCGGQSGTPWKVKELATRVLGEPSAAPATKEERYGCGEYGPRTGMRCNQHRDGKHRSMVYETVKTDRANEEWPIDAPSASGGDEARCERCGGSGRGPPLRDSETYCPACGGTGRAP